MTRKAAKGHRRPPKSGKQKADIGPHEAVYSRFEVEFDENTYLGNKQKPKVPNKPIKNRK